MSNYVVDRIPKEGDYHPRPPGEEESWESIVTLARLDEWYATEDEESSSSEGEEEDFIERWDQLEDALEKRRHHLQMVTESLNKSLKRQIWDRELQIANQKRQQLMEKEVRRLDRADVKERLKKAGWDIEKIGTEEGPKTCFRRFSDWILYEVNTFLPAILGVFLHSIAMGGFFEVVETLLQKLLSTVTVAFRSESTFVQSLVYVPALAIGLLALRSTGYLYWWLNDRDLDCLKIDYHNRLRLGFQGARFIHRVRSNLLVRMSVYMISYNLCYITANDLYAKLPYVWGEPISSRLVNLPSASAWLTSAEFSCLLPCNEEISRRDLINEMILSADFDYTAETLSADGHERYWLNYVYRHDYLPSKEKTEQMVSTWYGTLLQIALVFTSSLILMRLYGFVFWRTY